MSGSIWITRFDRCNHQLQQFTIGLFQLPVYTVQLTQSQHRNCEHKRTHNIILSVNPDEKENYRQREKIIRKCTQSVFPPDLPGVSPVDYSQCATNAN